MQIILDPTNSADLDAAEKIVQALRAKVRVSVVGQPADKTLRNTTPKVKAGVQNLTGKILAGLSRGRSSALSLRKFAGCKRRHGHRWKLAIDELLEQGKITKSGTGCGTTYHLVNLPKKQSNDVNELRQFLETALDEEDSTTPPAFDQAIRDGVIEAIKNGVHRAQTIRARLNAPLHPWRTTINHMLKTKVIRRVGWASGVNYYLAEVRNGITNRSND